MDIAVKTSSVAARRLCVLALRSLWIITLVISLAGAQKIAINPSGQQIKRQGQGFFLTCTTSGMDDVTNPRVHWVGPDKVVISATLGRIYTEQDDVNTIRLFISNFGEDDVGFYACAAEYGGVVLQKETEIVLYEEMVFADTPTFQQVDIGAEILLRCVVTGQPEPEVTWRFNKKTVPRESKKYAYTKGGLMVRDISIADNGTYECRAEVTSQGRLQSRKVDLDVLFAPEITEGPITTTVESGDDITLRCKARGNPDVRYEWFVEKRVQDMVKAKIPLRHSNTDVLSRRQITKATEGRYFCRAKNNLGHAEASADVFVIVPPVIQPLQEKIHILDDTMILNCETTGDPVPRVTWYRVGHEIPYRPGRQQNDKRITIETPHPGIAKLIIEEVNVNDTGAYRCEASNNIGTDEKITTLTVQYKPKILDTVKSQFSWPGQTVNITCQYDAEPPATISWYHRGVRLRKNATYTVIKGKSISTLQFKVSRQTGWVYGEYSCYAKNWLGLGRKSYSIIPIRAPGKPHNVTVMKLTPNDVVISLAIPKTSGRGAVKNIVVESVKNGKVHKNKTWTFPAKESFKVKSLTAGQKYTLLIYLRNIAGLGKPSKIVIVTPETFLADTSKLHEKPRQPKNHTVTTTTTTHAPGIKDAIIEEPLPPDNSPGGAVAGIVVSLVVIISGVVIAIWWFKFRKAKKDREYKFGPVATNRKPDVTKTIEDDPDVMDNPIKRTIRNMEIQHPVHIQMLSDKPIPNPIQNRQSGEDYQFYRAALEGTNDYYKVENGGNFRPEDGQATHAQLPPIKRNHSNGAILMIDHSAVATDCGDYAEFTTAEIHKRDSSPSPVLPDLPLSDPHGEFKLENVDWDMVLQTRGTEAGQNEAGVTFRHGRHHYNSPAQSTSDEHFEAGGGGYVYNQPPDEAGNYEYPPMTMNDDSGVMSDNEPIHTRYSLSIEDVTNSYLKSQHASEVDIPALFSVQDQGLQF